MFKALIMIGFLTASVSFAKDTAAAKKEDKRAPANAMSYRCTAAQSESTAQNMLSMCEDASTVATTSEGVSLACCLEKAAGGSGGAGQGGGR